MDPLLSPKSAPRAGGTPPGTYYNHAFAQHDAFTTPDTPDVPVTVTAPPEGPGTITKCADRATAWPCDPVIYTIAFTNDTASPITDLRIFDERDSELFVLVGVRALMDCANLRVTSSFIGGTTVVLSIDEVIPVGGTVCVTLVMWLRSTTPPGVYRNRAYARHGSSATSATPDVPITVPTPPVPPFCPPCPPFRGSLSVTAFSGVFSPFWA